ncbi:GapA-binding peptide SR1P [Paenibacillus koleovorans]|uniref:GapA-binding peptide SR1P n=1 Tax=Paenibacillus koleovorans TaxID=121608 RepID=UPI0013E38DD5|nr:GapA-binding peptide SR1P [Paenibacillus koleovorans]
MENTAVKLNLGVILCKHCSAIIDTVDSENVVTYYSVCQDTSCADRNEMCADCD